MAQVLLCDDDPTTLRLIGAALTRDGHVVTVAKDGLDAMVALKTTRPDILVLDIMMPELNGYDVCHNIKFDPDLKTIPIIIMTVRDQELDPRLGSLMGIRYLHKSSSPAELLRMIREILGPGKSLS